MATDDHYHTDSSQVVGSISNKGDMQVESCELWTRKHDDRTVDCWLIDDDQAGQPAKIMIMIRLMLIFQIKMILKYQTIISSNFLCHTSNAVFVWAEVWRQQVKGIHFADQFVIELCRCLLCPRSGKIVMVSPTIVVVHCEDLECALKIS